MNSPVLISWEAPEHIHKTKSADWYWAFGIIALALTAVCFIFGQIISGIFVLLAATALAIHVSQPTKIIHYEINDRGIMANNVLYPFLTIDSFSIPHDHYPPKILIRSHKHLMPLMVIYINDVDPEKVREILLTYIAEKEQHEPFLNHFLERFGF